MATRSRPGAEGEQIETVSVYVVQQKTHSASTPHAQEWHRESLFVCVVWDLSRERCSRMRSAIATGRAIVPGSPSPPSLRHSPRREESRMTASLRPVDPPPPLSPYTPSILFGLRVECPEGHLRDIEPVGITHDGACSWPSARDFCATCGAPIIFVAVMVALQTGA